MTSKTSHATTSPTLPDFPQLEEQVLQLWRTKKIFSQTLEKTASGKPFIFYEGPPTANGRPGIHHVLARVFKDAIVRFQTMQGRFVARRAGWDTHGLPVELAVEKELAISGKKDIEGIVPGDVRASIAAFNARCKQSVTSYIQEWEQLTERIGFWLDFRFAYRTYANPYIESLWWVIKQIASRKSKEGPLLYRGHKVVPHCPRCGTALSSHEVAQGYKKVKDRSVYVKFKVKGEDNTYLLSWTTTPWTLPGNVALAVNPKIRYTKTAPNNEGERFIIAEQLAVKLIGSEAISTAKGVVATSLSGEQLVGMQYEPLFNIPALQSETSHRVYAADFVNTDEGTGIVHTAVMYGEDDYQLGEKVGLPKVHTVTQDGKFNELVSQWQGFPVKHKDKPTEEKTTQAIIDHLTKEKLLYKEESHEHDYPFCWRCQTPLLYYAKDSWFIRVSAFREALIENNEQVNWIPGYIKNGRFGEWLKEAKDWAFSRERYWGTPLPIWICDDCGAQEIIGGFDELKEKAVKQTLPATAKHVFLMRHAHSEKNDTHSIATDISRDTARVTQKGKTQISEAIKDLKGKIDLIVTSDFLRTKETAQAIGETLQIPVHVDARLRELQYIPLEGKKTSVIKKLFPEEAKRINDAPPGCETMYDAALRLEEAMIDAVQQFPDKRILFISHGDPLWALLWKYSGKPEKEIGSIPYPKFVEALSLDLVNLPLNPHRPYIDEIHLTCSCKPGAVKRRVPEVADVWFDSGAMPFAQQHYPFAGENIIDSGQAFPADYISEAIDQTRGWFYTLLAVSTLLGKGPAYRNVISLGHILDDKGEKMSKSKGNIVNPWDVIHEHGIDALRLHFFSMNQPGDPKLFHKDGVRDVAKKTLLILWNVQTFFLLYGKEGIQNNVPKASHVLDRWLLSRVSQLQKKVTHELSLFHLFESSRLLRDFVTEMSTWYLRRSRHRIKEQDVDALATLGYVLWVVIRLFAPFTPFYSEILYQRMKGHKRLASIHLADWPIDEIPCDEALLKEMHDVKAAAELIHSIRKEAKIKSRQPLDEAAVSVSLSEEACAILAEEVNVDAIKVRAREDIVGEGWQVKEKGPLRCGLYTVVSEELQARGKKREIMRHINDLRKLARLTPEDIIVLYIDATAKLQGLIKDMEQEICATAGVKEIVYQDEPSAEVKKPVTIDGDVIHLGLKVV